MKQAAVFAENTQKLMTVTLFKLPYFCFSVQRQPVPKLFISSFSQSVKQFYPLILLSRKF